MTFCIYCSQHTPPDYDDCVHCGASLGGVFCDTCGIDISDDLTARSEGSCVDCFEYEEDVSDGSFDGYDDDPDDPDYMPF